MAKPHERVFAFMGAVLFLVTACALTIAVIWQSTQKSNTPAAGTPATSTNSKKLAGTQLAHFTPVPAVDKLQISDSQVGSGTAVAAGQTVSVDYTGAVAATGVIFQSSLDTGQPATISLGQVIQGWQEGIPGMKVGGTRRLVIPAAEAYGNNPPGGSGIPANAPLVFDITLHAISK
jgi:FKBP-type peptidyl-prolyl cis-trans isomerase